MFSVRPLRSLITLKHPKKPIDPQKLLSKKDPQQVKQAFYQAVDQKKADKLDKVNEKINWNPSQPHRLHTIFDDMERMVPNKGTPYKTGRSWDTHLLATKSFEDLREIWMVNLLERNKLLTRGAYAESLDNKGSAERWTQSWTDDGGINTPASDTGCGTGRDEGAIYGVGPLGAIGGEQGVRLRKVQTTLNNIKFVIRDRQDRYLKALKLHYMKYYEGYAVNVPTQYLQEDSIGDNYNSAPNEVIDGEFKYKFEDFDDESQRNIQNYEALCKDKELLFDLVQRGYFLPNRGEEIVRQLKTPEAQNIGKRILYRKHWRYGQVAKVKQHYKHFDTKMQQVMGGNMKSQVLDFRPLHDRRLKSRRRISKFRLKRGHV